ncbi:MAG: SelT/SelW/SelH family protein [Chloroflexi bacterium]|nr:SelT/SelW/SelH family protein [Chloroflexota bacterium]
MSLAEDLLREYERDITGLTLVPSEGGRFEVTVNGQLLYSKLETKRHAEPGEVLGLVRKMVEG